MDTLIKVKIFVHDLLIKIDIVILKLLYHYNIHQTIHANKIKQRFYYTNLINARITKA